MKPTLKSSTSSKTSRFKRVKRRSPISISSLWGTLTVARARCRGKYCTNLARLVTKRCEQMRDMQLRTISRASSLPMWWMKVRKSVKEVWRLKWQRGTSQLQTATLRFLMLQGIVTLSQIWLQEPHRQIVASSLLMFNQLNSKEDGLKDAVRQESTLF